MARSYAPSGEEIRNAMRNRYYTPGVVDPYSYQVINASQLSGIRGSRVRGVHGSPRGVHGFGSICDDTGAAIAMSIIGAAAGAVGGAVSAAGNAGKDAGAAAAGSAISNAGASVGNAWAAACLSAPRGEATGTTPSESIEDAVARANASLAADIAAQRDADIAVQAAESARNRNILIGVGIVGAVVVGGLLLTRK